MVVILAICPKSDDPWTTDQMNREIKLKILSQSGEPLAGQIGIKLYGYISYIYMSDPLPTNQLCKASLELSPQIGTVVCNYTIASPFVHELNISFVSWPLFTPDNNIYVNNGNPSVVDFFCDTSLSVDPENTLCYFEDLVVNNIKGMFFPILILLDLFIFLL
jgi:hypothetical protein